MGSDSKTVTPNNTDSEEGEAFTDSDFGDSDNDIHRTDNAKTSKVPVNETVNRSVVKNGMDTNGHTNGFRQHAGHHDAEEIDVQPATTEIRRESLIGDQSPSILGILGNQHHQAEQRLAARRAARAEAREIRMRELERQQREQEDHADKAFDMYTESVGRRGRLAGLSPGALHSPRRSSEDSADDGFCVKDLRHELKEVEEKFRKAMILNAQLDNDKAALAYQLELLKDRLEELQEEHAQLQREHKEKCSAFERVRREHASLEREVSMARDAVRARDTAALAAGYAFVEAGVEPGDEDVPPGEPCGTVPPLALVSRDSERLLNEAGEGTLDVRLQNILNQKLGLESEVRKLKLQLNDERAARHNGVAHPHHDEYENELETLRKCVSDAKARAARAEAEAALQGAAVARLEAQVSRLRARQDHQDEHEEQLKQERRRLQREAREALNRVEELETENSHLTKRLDKLKNAKSALLKEL